MDRREAIKAVGAWLTSALIAPYIEMAPSGAIFPDPDNEIVSIEMVGLYSVLIRRQFDGVLIYGDVVHSEEFQDWLEIINTA